MNANLSRAENIVATRKANLFNSRYRIGDAVMYIPAVGANPVWDRVFSAARVQAGRAVVTLAGRELPVETDQCYAPPAEASHVRSPEARVVLWKVVTPFVLGMAAAVLLALTLPAAKAVPPENIVIDCAEPGEMPAEEGAQA